MTTTPEPSADQLDTAADLAERGFLVAGQSLEEAVVILDRLTERFAKHVAELSTEALDETRRHLAAADAHITLLADGRRSDAAALTALAEMVTATERRIAALQPITQEVETLSLHARVVAGAMGAAGEDFVAFAGSIRDAAQHARSCLQEARLALGRVDHELTAACTEVKEFALRYDEAIRAIPTRLAGNLRSLSTQRQLATDAVTAAYHQSEAVRRQVAEQIVALQLGDITRQRLEHVLAATRLAPEKRRDVGELLAAQLNDTANELEREGQRIEVGLPELAQAARAIGQLGVRVHGETKGSGFVATLEADIRQTAALCGQLSAGDTEINRRMAAVLETASVLAARLASVQSVQEDIRIMALNATLKCGRLGTAGRALAAVAQELRLGSERFGVHAVSVLHDLDRLQQIATNLRDPSRSGEHAELTQAIDQMRAPLQRLGQLDYEMVATLSGLQADADEVGRLVEAALAHFAVHHALARTLRAEAAAFAAWTDFGDSEDDLLDRIASTYTMAREREVHCKFAPLREAAVSADVADVLF